MFTIQWTIRWAYLLLLSLLFPKNTFGFFPSNNRQWSHHSIRTANNNVRSINTILSDYNNENVKLTNIPATAVTINNNRTKVTKTTIPTTTIIGLDDNNVRYPRKNIRKYGQNRQEEIYRKINDFHLLSQQELYQSNNGTNVQEVSVVTQKYCDYLIAECVAINEWDSAQKVINIMKHIPNIQYGHSSYKACIQACYDIFNIKNSYKIFLEMEQANIQPDNTDIDLIIRTMCRPSSSSTTTTTTTTTTGTSRSTGTSTGSIYDSNSDSNNRKLTSYQSTKFLKNDENGWIDKGLQLVTQYNNLPITSYDTVLESLLKERRWQESVRLVRSMEQNFVNTKTNTNTNATRPELSTYRIVIECCIISNQPDIAVQILQSCMDHKYVPSLHTFEIVISSLTKKLQWRRSIHLLDVMEQKQIPNSIRIYNSIIIACCKAKESVQARNLLSRMTLKDKIRPTINTYNSIISVCASTNDWQNALSIFDLANREPGVTPDIYTYTNAIRACAKGGQTRRAMTLFQVVKDKKLPIDAYCYTAVIEACSRGGLWERALECMKEMEQSNILPTEVTFNVIITACGNGGQWQKALDLLSEMRLRQIPINLFVYNAVITALSKAAKRNTKSTAENDIVQFYPKIMNIVEEMKNDGVEPDGFTYSGAISCCGAEGLWEESLVIINMMKNGGPRTQPNKIAYTAAISSCGRAGQVNSAIQLFNEMKQQGLYVDRVAYNALFSAFRVAKQSHPAYQLWNEMIGIQQPQQQQQQQQQEDDATTTMTISPSSFGRRIGTIRSLQPTTPDIITVSDAIAAISYGSDEKVACDRVDMVFNDAVRRGIVLRGVNNQIQVEENEAHTDLEVDLSGMSFPVARAACRYVLGRICHIATTSNKKGKVRNLSFVTGIGASHARGSSGTSNSNTLSLREYLQEILLADFVPSINSIVEDHEQSKVKILASSLRSWIDEQRPTRSDTIIP